MKLVILLSLASPLLCLSQCGTRHVEATTDSLSRASRFIIGGNKVNVGKWPWQVGIFIKNDTHLHACGGTVISEQWILTAAHCVAHNDISVLVMNGISRLTQPKQFETNVIQTIVHEKYVSGLFTEYDIALLKLDKPIFFNEDVSPICLPAMTQSIPSDGLAVITGYGLSNERGTGNITFDSQLRDTIVPIINAHICEERSLGVKDEEQSEEDAKVDDFLRRYWRSMHWICAGSLGHGVHEGDSGGPLMMKSDDGRWFQIGITSYGGDDPIPSDLTPNVFTDVRKYCKWIKKQTGGDVRCPKATVTLQDVEIHV